MLRNDPRLIRMATVLSRRNMKVSELAQLSLQPMDEAYVFVQALRSADMLDIRVGAEPVATPLPSPRFEKPLPRIERSLVSRIRFRLGL